MKKNRVRKSRDTAPLKPPIFAYVKQQQIPQKMRATHFFCVISQIGDTFQEYSNLKKIDFKLDMIKF